MEAVQPSGFVTWKEQTVDKNGIIIFLGKCTFLNKFRPALLALAGPDGRAATASTRQNLFYTQRICKEFGRSTNKPSDPWLKYLDPRSSRQVCLLDITASSLKPRPASSSTPIYWERVQVLLCTFLLPLLYRAMFKIISTWKRTLHIVKKVKSKCVPEILLLHYVEFG